MACYTEYKGRNDSPMTEHVCKSVCYPIAIEPYVHTLKPLVMVQNALNTIYDAIYHETI